MFYWRILLCMVLKLVWDRLRTSGLLIYPFLDVQSSHWLVLNLPVWLQRLLKSIRDRFIGLSISFFIVSTPNNELRPIPKAVRHRLCSHNLRLITNTESAELFLYLTIGEPMVHGQYNQHCNVTYILLATIDDH